MIIYSKVITQPSAEPLTLAEAKSMLKIDSTDEDDYIVRLIMRARRMTENYCALSLLTQEREINLDCFPCGIINVPYGPVQSVDSFTYIDADGDEQTLVEGTDFRVDTKSDVCRIEAINSWPTAKTQVNAVTIQYTAGFTNVGEDWLPEEAIEMCSKLVARMYEKRGDENYPVLTDEIMQVGDLIKAYWNANA
jgi:uncharacterized phiE125 gp8 family phage protein